MRARSVAPLVAVVAIAGCYLFWFEASWAWNYDRAPVESRVAYDRDRVNPHALDLLRTRAIVQLNRLAPQAHAGADAPLDLDALRDAWLPVVHASGDTWNPLVGPPKPTLANLFMNASGTNGFVNPLSLNVQLASDLLWFERPFALAHEWSHLAGFAREDEANYLAILTCTRSPDPVLKYSGWLELLLYLPSPGRRYPRSTFSPLVWADFAAMRRRDERHVNLSLARFSWGTYNIYLKSNHVAGGTRNYGEVARLYMGVPLGRSGLPLPR
jgi:hypothetical protein